MTTRRPRPRKEFKFWLYWDLPEQVRLMEYVDYLRKTRQFASTLRNGLRLMWTLSEGDLSVLFELFPGLRAQLQPPAPSTPPDDFQRMLTEAARAGAQQALMQAPALPAPPPGMPLMQPVMKGLKPMNAPKELPFPTFDDDDQDGATITIRTDASAAGKGAAAFMDSVLALNQ